MSLFSSNLSYLGVDIGTAGIKAVELKNENGRPRLVTYGFVEESVDVVHDSSPQTQAKAVKLLVRVLREAKVTAKRAVTALPSFSIFSSIISLPPMNKKDLAKAIYWQAKKFVPMPLEEMTLDWKLLDSDVKAVEQKEKVDKELRSIINNGKMAESSQTINLNNQEKSNSEEKDGLLMNKDNKNKNDLKVLIAAAPKKLVLRYMDIFQQAGLELFSLETENFALERALVGGDKAPVMVVDVGSITSDIIIVENSIPLLSRSVDSGGEAITQAIMNSMHIDKKRAEQFKRDIGFTPGQGNLPKVIETSINPIINEIKYCFDLYASQQSQQRIDKIILSGGSAFLPNITSYLEQLLNIKVFIGDPWSRIIYPVDLKPVLDSLAPRFGIAVGLAMREIV